MFKKVIIHVLILICILAACSGKGENTSRIKKADSPAFSGLQNQDLDSAVFAGGCFWCTEAYFENIFGVKDVVSGYSGGTAETASYELVSTGKTAHAEAILIIYNPAIVSYRELLEVFFYTMDPTQLNRQGNDVGPQYRSVVFYKNEIQKKEAEDYINLLKAGGEYTNPIVTAVEPLDHFFEAENYHQDFYQQNPSHPYNKAVTKPKMEKFEQRFHKLLEPAE